MVDWDHYKTAYRGEWEAGNRRERLVAEIIGRLGFDVSLEGFGAGSSTFLPGRASRHGHERAAPDLRVAETGTRVEVTGTNVGWVRPTNDLYVRPDKFGHALAGGADAWLVHVLDGPAVLRCIELTDAVCRTFVDRGEPVETRHDAGETYVKIDPDHDCVQPIERLLAHLTDGREGRFETAIDRSLARWTLVDDVEDGVRHSIALQVRSVADRAGRASSPRRLELVDRDGVAAAVRIDGSGDWEPSSWELGGWYFFRDLVGDRAGGEPALASTRDTRVERIDAPPWE